jgi:hypothetical protein
MNRILPVRTAWLYGPIGDGAAEVVMMVLLIW